MAESKNSFNAKKTLEVGDKSYDYFALDAVEGMEKLPYSLKVLGENLLRTEDGKNVTADHINAIANWDPSAEPSVEIQFTPARVLMQDFTGVPCVVDLATMREAVSTLGGSPDQVNPLNPAEMVIDHSVIIEAFGSENALDKNVEIEYQRNEERYQFLRWGAENFSNFRVVPPGTGIVHQVNIEYLSASSSTTRALPTRTPASAPTPTPPWKTAWASWAGVSAASRLRLQCWASRSPCSSRALWASSSPARSRPA